ncbi:metabolite traffic protein EboE [Aureibacter tunicatorum]|uniref:Xylose isomerase n=1 Tax=Aureibacter tunicatorum TaxID=866807 RepID=A0AAE4BU31_9BACT|nr:metabolite traffic protein EboE [Aureibacter tunicatorum]MDR6240595.1 hypothetical protein [Aureibacter tunicatorum]BDD06544.1 sugar phosphate isomerase [Aureibacter tunicatorum]
MNINNRSHLTYCTNMHPGETWQETFEELKNNLPYVKQSVSPHQPFGIGLRLSHQASLDILAGDHLSKFKHWLYENDLYVFTINGFPYGKFHFETVKDKVHLPDWTTIERLEYTERLSSILAHMLPENMEGGISTSPISYVHWHNSVENRISVKKTAAKQFAQLVIYLHKLEKATGKCIHIDIEPEPDGMLENSTDFISFFNEFLLTFGLEVIAQELNIEKHIAEQHIRRYIRLCYDICHFSLAYESPTKVVQSMKDHQLKIGKIQISSALKFSNKSNENHSTVISQFKHYDEPIYLHQTVIKQENKITKYSDLGLALSQFDNDKIEEIKTHFHVPIFTEDYGLLSSTQEDIIDALKLWKKEPYADHLEVETYTWQVLPQSMQMSIQEGITKELKWVLNQLSE